MTMHDNENMIHVTGDPLSEIGAIAARRAAELYASVSEFAKMSDEEYVVFSAVIEKREDGVFCVTPGFYTSVPWESPVPGFCVYPGFAEDELELAISASIIRSILYLGADHTFFVDGSFDEIEDALHLAVDRKTVALAPGDSAWILRDTVEWRIAKLREREMIIA